LPRRRRRAPAASLPGRGRGRPPARAGAPRPSAVSPPPRSCSASPRPRRPPSRASPPERASARSRTSGGPGRRPLPRARRAPGSSPRAAARGRPRKSSLERGENEGRGEEPGRLAFREDDSEGHRGFSAPGPTRRSRLNEGGTMRLTGSGSRSIALCLLAPLVVGGGSALLGVCGPFTDVAPDVFCPFVLEIFTLGITTGTTPSTYDPSANVSRLQMAAFLSRTVDRVLTRGGRRAALNQFWTIQGSINLALTTVGASSQFVQSDGADLWVGEYGAGTVARIRGSDGRRLETWTTPAGMALLPATGKVFVAGFANPGTLYRIDPSQPAGAATVVASTLGANPRSIAFDGSR